MLAEYNRKDRTRRIIIRKTNKKKNRHKHKSNNRWRALKACNEVIEKYTTIYVIYDITYIFIASWTSQYSYYTMPPSATAARETRSPLFATLPARPEGAGEELLDRWANKT
jgi:hypothetical protein